MRMTEDKYKNQDKQDKQERLLNLYKEFIKRLDIIYAAEPIQYLDVDIPIITDQGTIAIYHTIKRLEKEIFKNKQLKLFE